MTRCLPFALKSALTLALTIVPTVAFAQDDLDPEARDLFVAKCASCHTVGKGERVGPDLKGVPARRDAAWLRTMIQSPSDLLDSDADARALLAKYKGVRMPDLGLSDEQTDSLVALLTLCSEKTCELKGKFKPVTEANEADVALGLAFFVGTEAFAKGGPSCIACHSAGGAQSLAGGGTLSKDLTHAFARLGDEGLDASLRNPTFKLMNKVFGDHPLSESEAFALRAFLNESNKGTSLADHEATAPLSVPLAAVLFAFAALFILNAAWSRRHRGVRQALVAKKGL